MVAHQHYALLYFVHSFKITHFRLPANWQKLNRGKCSMILWNLHWNLWTKIEPVTLWTLLCRINLKVYFRLVENIKIRVLSTNVGLLLNYLLLLYVTTKYNSSIQNTRKLHSIHDDGICNWGISHICKLLEYDYRIWNALIKFILIPLLEVSLIIFSHFNYSLPYKIVWCDIVFKILSRNSN